MQMFSLLSRPAILRHVEEGNIVIDPFDEKHLGTASYDVSLGEWFYKEKDPSGALGFYNPYDIKHVCRVWGEPQKAELVSEWGPRIGVGREIEIDINGIFWSNRVIWIAPGETVLAHTQEFIGGRNCITTMMKARSSIGKNFIEVCKCAGWGDVGYVNRWTMEVTNNSRYYHIPLVIGRRVAQIAFFEVEPIGEDYVDRGGKYQASRDLEELKATWTPEMMLPRLDRDYEIAEERKMVEEISDRVKKRLTREEILQLVREFSKMGGDVFTLIDQIKYRIKYG